MTERSLSRLTAKRLRIAVFTALTFAFLLLAHYPGMLTNDGLGQIEQAVQGEYHDWHPPIVAATWRALLLTTSEFGSLFFTQALMLCLGLVLLSTGLLHRLGWSVLLVLAIVLSPPVFTRIAILGKDMPALAMALISVGAALHSLGAKGRWIIFWRSLSVLAAIFAASLRHEFGIAVSPAPLLSFWPLILRWQQSVLTKIAASLGGLALMALGFLLAGNLVNASVALTGPVQERHASQQGRLFDLAGLSLMTDEILIPKEFLKDGTDLAKLEKHFSYYLSDWLMFQKDDPLERLTDPEALGKLRRAWVVEIVQHPDLYVVHRLRSYQHALGLEKERRWASLPNYNEKSASRFAEYYPQQIPHAEDRIYRPNSLLEGYYRLSKPSREVTLWDPLIPVAFLAITSLLVVLMSISERIDLRLRLGLVTLLAMTVIHNLLILAFGPGYVVRYFLLTYATAISIFISILYIMTGMILDTLKEEPGQRWQRLGQMMAATFPAHRAWSVLEIRYIVVGSALAGLYLVLTLIGFALFPTASETLVSNAALLITILVQYFGHSILTFESRVNDPLQVGRFIGTIIVGMTISSVTMTFGPKVLGWDPAFLTIFVMAGVPIFNFIAFRMFVFNRRHGLLPHGSTSEE